MKVDITIEVRNLELSKSNYDELMEAYDADSLNGFFNMLVWLQEDADISIEVQQHLNAARGGRE